MFLFIFVAAYQDHAYRTKKLRELNRPVIHSCYEHEHTSPEEYLNSSKYINTNTENRQKKVDLFWHWFVSVGSFYWQALRTIIWTFKVTFLFPFWQSFFFFFSVYFFFFLVTAEFVLIFAFIFCISLFFASDLFLRWIYFSIFKDCFYFSFVFVCAFCIFWAWKKQKTFSECLKEKPYKMAGFILSFVFTL